MNENVNIEELEKQVNLRISVLIQQRNSAMDQAAFWQTKAQEFEQKYLEEKKRAESVVNKE